MTSDFVHGNGIDIHYRIAGEAAAPPLVLINGVGDDLDGWANQVDDFVRAGLRVISYDNRGVGRSGQPPGPYTSAEMAADTKALVTALGLPRFHLAGVSMGGAIAQEYAVAHPGDLLSLVLANTFAVADPFTAAAFGAQMAALTGHDCAGRIGAVTVPTLVLAASGDIIIRPELSRRLFDALGDGVGTWAVVPGGHAAFWENPRPWNSAVIDFVRRNGTL